MHIPCEASDILEGTGLVQMLGTAKLPQQAAERSRKQQKLHLGLVRCF